MLRRLYISLSLFLCVACLPEWELGLDTGDVITDQGTTANDLTNEEPDGQFHTDERVQPSILQKTIFDDLNEQRQIDLKQALKSYLDGHLLPLAGLEGVQAVSETLGDLWDLVWLWWSQLDLSITPKVLQLWLREFDGAFDEKETNRDKQTLQSFICDLNHELF